MTLMGLVTNYAGLLTCRWFLGLAEAGLFPGVNYYLSCWYKRSELGIRAATFFSAAALAGSFGGLLAAAIAQMDGIGGKEGWVSTVRTTTISFLTKQRHGFSSLKALPQCLLAYFAGGWSSTGPILQVS